jgi:hypothetical protein
MIPVLPVLTSVNQKPIASFKMDKEAPPSSVPMLSVCVVWVSGCLGVFVCLCCASSSVPVFGGTDAPLIWVGFDAHG